MDQATKPSSTPPGGRLSSIRCPQGNIHIQTEFATFPSDRIVTTAMLNGAVLFKNILKWHKTFFTRESYLEAEESLNSQHQKICEETRHKVMLNGIDDLLPKMDSETDEGGILKIIEKVRLIENCVLLEVIDQSGQAVYTVASTHQLYGKSLTSAVRAFAGFLSDKLQCGDFRRASLHSPSKNFCWATLDNHLFTLQSPKPEATLIKFSEIIESDERASS